MACDTYSLIKFFVFQLLYLFQRHIEYMLMAWIYLCSFPGFHIQIIKGGTGQPHRAWDWHIEESERMSASSYADWSYIDMQYTYPPHVLWDMSLTHKCRLAHPRISGTCADRSYIEIFLRWTYLPFGTCDAYIDTKRILKHVIQIYIHHAHKYPPHGVALVTCHLPHVGQLIRPLIPNTNTPTNTYTQY